jgi:hypothetical protein
MMMMMMMETGLSYGTLITADISSLGNMMEFRSY